MYIIMNNVYNTALYFVMYFVLFPYIEGFWQQLIVHFMFSIVESIVFYTLYMMENGKSSSGNMLTTLMFVYRTVYSTLYSSAVYNIAFSIFLCTFLFTY